MTQPEQEPVAWVDPATLHHLKIGLEGVHLVYETEMVNSLPLYEKPHKTENLGCLGMPVNVPVTPPQRTEQEPVAYLTKRKIGGTEGLLRADMVDRSAKNQETHDFIPLYTTPPQRTWVGLTDEEIKELDLSNYVQVVRIVEAKLKDKNL